MASLLMRFEIVPGVIESESPDMPERVSCGSAQSGPEARAAHIEARLSMLCHWVLQADRFGQSYGLRLPGTVIPPNRGDAHRARCLEALALFRAPGAGP